ncbi:glycosyltransferase family 2 protein [Treponema endosymbiont of Eucomonympha sp.]|uniref:glycosyltransferase family 2 protein n=1 Tax=Treponema endosymbiont of Eucomonympha sp. TaxID=1580831 RepID=UPI000A680853|nr:glycosyltransferase family 2 protein [Treponema endosymbiont of Eucomonympha sp.]
MKYDRLTFSIIIPVYNASHFLEMCLDSCVNQLYTNIEIICIDDCSTDNSREIIKRFQNKDKRIKGFYHEKNESQYIARRTGIMNATGDYILFLDNDDSLALDACMLLARHIEKTLADMIQFGYTEVPRGKKIFSPFYQTAKKRIAAYLAKENRYSPEIWTKAYKRDLILTAYNTMDIFYCSGPEDIYTSIVITHFTKSFSFLKKSLVHYSNETGMSMRKMDSIQPCIAWLTAYHIIIEKTAAFIKKYLPEYTDKCTDMEFYFLKDFLFCRLPQLSLDISCETKYQIATLLPSCFSYEVLLSFFEETVQRYNEYDRLNFICSFFSKTKKLLKIVAIYLKSFF